MPWGDRIDPPPELKAVFLAPSSKNRTIVLESTYFGRTTKHTPCRMAHIDQELQDVPVLPRTAQRVPT